MEESPTKLILSWHDFKETPSAAELTNLLQQMAGSGAHIGKIVTTAHNANDVLRVLALQEEARAAGFSLIAFCMGEAGRISRLATLYLGGYMSYACLNEEHSAAPGQISIRSLREMTLNL
jgi:3-dehydroquinate dehydratase-1/3-dehydroquinate dehydratase/shikimate dehydrogenase